MSKNPLPTEYAYKWEKEIPDSIWMTQPIGDGQVVTYTWAEAMDQARRMASYLKSLNLPPGSNIAQISKNCAHFVLTDLAIWMAGHCSVALYPTLNANTVEWILKHSESKLLFVGKLDDWDEVKNGIPADLQCISFPLAPPNDYPTWDSLVADQQPIAGDPQRSNDETAIIVYTSGSTGRPKGVVHEFGGLADAVAGGGELFELTKHDRMLSYLPLAHVFERAVVEQGSLRSGMQLFFAESLATFVDDIKRARPTVFVSVPRLWLKFQQGVHAKLPPARLNRLLRIPIVSEFIKKKVLGNLGLDHVKIAASGSAPIPPELIQWYNNLGLELLEGYGMSEDFAYSHFSRMGAGKPGYVGTPAPGVDVKISEEGEIQVKSPGNMAGYYKEPEMTAACYTSDGYFKTGDRGERDAQGRLKITGRTKELFKTSKGKYVAPAPIENIINNDSHVESSCVSGSGQPQPFALISLSEQLRPQLSSPDVRQQIEAELSNLLEEVNKRVEHHEQLQFLTVVKEPWLIENGYLTPTMKIKRSKLEDSYGPKVEGWYATGQRVVWES